MDTVGPNDSQRSIRLWEDAAFWEKAWQQERRSSLYGLEQPGKSGGEWWDQRAEGFAKQIKGEAGRQRQDEMIRIFERLEFLEPNMEVLDIGCGPGTYALDLARRVKKVVALDPSPKMLAILEQRVAEEGITNIETVCSTWEDVDLTERGWKKAFGLVLAALTPGVNDMDTVKKMIAASNQGCFYKGMVKRDDLAQQELWIRLFQTEIPPIPADVFYIYHLLYAWGFCPSLELRNRYIKREVTRDQAIKELEIAMIPNVEITDRIREEIIKVVEERSQAGCFYQERDIIEGNLSWQVE